MVRRGRTGAGEARGGFVATDAGGIMGGAWRRRKRLGAAWGAIGPLPYRLADIASAEHGPVWRGFARPGTRSAARPTNHATIRETEAGLSPALSPSGSAQGCLLPEGGHQPRRVSPRPAPGLVGFLSGLLCRIASGAGSGLPPCAAGGFFSNAGRGAALGDWE